MTNLKEEATPTEAYTLPTPRLDEALKSLGDEVSRGVDQRLLQVCVTKSTIRIEKREIVYRDTVRSLPPVPRPMLKCVFHIKGLLDPRFCVAAEYTCKDDQFSLCSLMTITSVAICTNGDSILVLLDSEGCCTFTGVG